MSKLGMIKITGCDLEALVKKAYQLSRPQGLGWIDKSQDKKELTDNEVSNILSAPHEDWVPVQIDYLHGKAVKLTVFRFDDQLYVENYWHDHSDQDFLALLSSIGIPEKAVHIAKNEKAEYKAMCLSKALKLLSSQGVVYGANLSLKHDEDIYNGLLQAREEGLVRQVYENDSGPMGNWYLVNDKVN